MSLPISGAPGVVGASSTIKDFWGEGAKNVSQIARDNSSEAL